MSGVFVGLEINTIGQNNVFKIGEKIGRAHYLSPLTLSLPFLQVAAGLTWTQNPAQIARTYPPGKV